MYKISIKVKQRIKFLKVGISFLLLLLATFIGISQNIYYEQLTEQDGLPSMTTYEMVQDSNSIIWVGTENGLISYDGEIIQKYSHPSLIDNDIIEIAVDKSNIVYFLNISHQLAYIEDGEVKIVNTDNLNGKIKDILTLEDQNYVLVRNFEDYSVKFYMLNRNEEKEYVFEHYGERLFFSDQKKFHPYKYQKLKKKIEVIDLKFDSFANTKINQTIDNRFFNFNNNWTIFEVDSIINNLSKHKELIRITKHKNKIFLIYDKGIEIFNTESKEHFPFLSNITTNTIFVDKERNIWASTSDNGLIKIPHLDFQFESPVYNFIKDYGINDIVQDRFGYIYLGTTDGHILFLSQEKNLLRKDSISNSARPVTFMKHNNVIFGTSKKTVFSIDAKSRSIKALKNDHIVVKSILVGDDMTYFGSPSGFYKTNFENYTELKFNVGSILRGSRINAFYQEPAHETVFIGTSTGLYSFNKETDTAPKEYGETSKYNISCIEGASQNALWFGTRSAGAIKIYEDRIIERFDNSNGSISNNINAIKIIDNNLILSTVEGISIKNLATGEVNSIGELNGILPKEILTCEVIDGEYWIGSSEGLSIIDPKKLHYLKSSGPTLSIKNIFANGAKTKIEKNIQFSHKVNTVLINFRNISHLNSKKTSLKYRIKTIDTSWVYSTDPLIRLQSLKQGEYTIEALGLNSKNVEGNKVSLTFKINRPWWNTIWARMIWILSLITTVIAIIHNRGRRIRKEESQKRDYLSQINKIKDQALQLQMNPHFIFNSLNAIQGFIGTENEEMAMNYLARFARLIRLIFEHSKGNSITLEEELEFIHLYLDLEKLRFKDKVNIEIIIDLNVEEAKDMINVPPLLIQPIIENSFKHGLFHKKGKGTLKVKYTLQNEILQVIIQDDGIGRVESKKISHRNIEKKSSSGIQTTLERINLLNFDKDKKLNRIEIEDLYDNEGNTMGTKTTLYLFI